jgi:hypothetical protein
VPFRLAFSPLEDSSRPAYGSDLEAALERYYRRISDVLRSGLTTAPWKLAPVRDLLMQAYADAAKIAGRAQPLADPRGARDLEAAVDGVLVPVPFRLVFEGS